MGDDGGAEPNLGLTENGIVRGDGQIAHHQVAATGQAMTVHLGNDRPGMIENLEQAIEAVGEVVEGAPGSRFLREVVTGAERAAGAGYHDHPDIGVNRRLAQGP